LTFACLPAGRDFDIWALDDTSRELLWLKK
jgi:hypothetical protein